MQHIERHRSHRAGWLRAGVLGANDGIVSTASLVIGVAAADSGRQTLDQRRQPGLRGGVDPVQVLHRQEQRLLLTAVQRQLSQDGKDPAPTLFRAAGRQLC